MLAQKSILLTLPLFLFSFSALAFPQYEYGEVVKSSNCSEKQTQAVKNANGTTHDVAVGKDGLVFSPDSLTASIGDTINFHFYAKNHSVVQSSFDSPCQPLSSSNSSATTVYSGFMPVSGEGQGESVFSMTVNSTGPIWLYCSQGKHCQGGMGMVINQPSDGAKTLEAYKEAAKAVEAAGNPTTEGPSAGILVASNGAAVAWGSNSSSDSTSPYSSPYSSSSEIPIATSTSTTTLNPTSSSINSPVSPASPSSSLIQPPASTTNAASSTGSPPHLLVAVILPLTLAFSTFLLHNQFLL
jgi:plastocyanin